MPGIHPDFAHDDAVNNELWLMSREVLVWMEVLVGEGRRIGG